MKIAIHRRLSKRGKTRYIAYGLDAAGNVVEGLEHYSKKGLKKWVCSYPTRLDWSQYITFPRET